MKNRILVHFTLTGTGLEPDEVTAATGLSPGKVWRAGDFIAGSGRRYEYGGWRIASGLDDTAGIAEQLAALLGRLEPVRAGLARFMTTEYGEIGCVVYAHESVPEMHLSRDLLRRTADLGVEVDIDLYCLIDDEEEEQP